MKKRFIRKSALSMAVAAVLCMFGLCLGGDIYRIGEAYSAEEEGVDTEGVDTESANTGNASIEKIGKSSTDSAVSAAIFAQPDTFMYGIGSTSKVVTAAAVMKLSEEGRLDLDRPLTEYLSEFEMADSRYKQITPRMLLDHSSGLQGGTLNSAMLLGDHDTENHDMLLTRLKSQRLKAEPGEIQAYCNDGYTLAELLVERVSGISFTEYIVEEFAKPLGLEQFQTPQTSGLEERLAAVYDTQTGAKLPCEMANVIGSGGIYTTAEELCRFSELFMDGAEGKERLISAESLLAMEDSRYDREVNPSGYDTMLSYGLGWDSVNTYPYSRYGIKALVKGGDTNYYHASLTVLPKEHISCAVLSSGGASIYNQLAVQEIVMTYLDEIERIEREDETAGFNYLEKKEETAAIQEEPDAAVSEELTARSGWYAGSDMLHVMISSDGGMELTAVGSGTERRQTYRYLQDGRFYSIGSSYVDASGGLSKGSNGRIGKTRLSFQQGAGGAEYLMAETTEVYPGLGRSITYLPVGAYYSGSVSGSGSIPSEAAVRAWEEVSGTEYYLVSDKYSSAAYLKHFMVKPFLLSEPEGILSFENMDLRMAAVTDAAHAEFFTKVPGQAGRDLNDYTLTEEKGTRYLEAGDSRFISDEDLPELSDWESTVVIGDSGEAVWYSTGENGQGIPLMIDTPENGAWYVYDHSGNEMKCVSSSWTLEEGQSFYLPRDGRLAFVGTVGTVFQLHEGT